MTPAIQVLRQAMSFGENSVLGGISFEAAEGTVFALLGPNGAGKTTAVNIMFTLMQPDGGTVRFIGHDVVREPSAARAVIGLTGQLSAVDTLLTGREDLAPMAELRRLGRREGKQRVATLLG